MNNDIIIDTLDTLIALLQRNGGVYLPAQRAEAERIARAAWGGERPYVGKLGESGQRALSERDRAIMREHRRGVHVPVLARRHGITERRVKQILQILQEPQEGAAESTAQASVQGAAETACLTDFQAGREATRSPKPARLRQQGEPKAA